MPKPERDRSAGSERGESKPSRSSNGSSKRSDSSSGQQQQQMGSGFGPFNPNVGFGPMGAQFNNPFDPASSSTAPSPFLNPSSNPFWSNNPNPNAPHMQKSSQGSSSSSRNSRGSRMDRSRNSDSRREGGGGGGWNR